MMADLLFEQLLIELAEFNISFPDKRFGEVIQKSADMAMSKYNVDIHDLSTKKLLSGLDLYKKSLGGK